MLVKKLEELADEKKVVGNRTKYHFNKGLIVKCLDINEVFFDIIKEEDQLLLFSPSCAYVRVIEEIDYPITEIFIKGD